MLLSELCRLTGKTQRPIAKILGVKQPSMSTLEKEWGAPASPVGTIMQALGGELQILIKLPDAPELRVTVGPTVKPRRKKSRQ